MPRLVFKLCHIKPVWLLLAYVISGFIASSEYTGEMTTSVLGILGGLMFFSLIYLWPVAVSAGMNSLSWVIKGNLQQLILIIAFSVSLVSAMLKILLDLTFVEDGNIFSLIIVVLVIASYGGFYPLFLNGSNTFWDKFRAINTAILLCVFLPIGCFYISKALTVYRSNKDWGMNLN